MQPEMEAQKRKRYDRQLRIWGEQGQECLERCNLCLINGSAAGTETLKNLVLPGIGSFTVVDSAVVSARDLGNNFFLEESMIGRRRAESVTALLKEMNEHVRGSYVNEDITTLLDSTPDCLHEFTIVVATQLPEHVVRRVAAACAERGTPLVVLRSSGLFGSVRLVAREHVISQGHPDNVPSDLRVCAPFPGLLAYVRDHFASVGALSTIDRKHVPFVVLLIKALDKYKEEHTGKLPTTYREKQEVKTILSQMSDEWFGVGGGADAINFDEAKAAVNTAVSSPTVALHVRDVLSEARARLGDMLGKADAAASPHPSDPAPHKTFWILAAGLGRFVENEGGGCLPLTGILPDMTSDSHSYVRLQAVYKERANMDAGHVHAHVQDILSVLGQSQDYITVEQTRAFCKNAHSIQWMRVRSLQDEFTPATSRLNKLELGDSSSAPAAVFYILQRATDAFYAQYNRWPGTMDDDIESDVPLLKQTANQLFAEMKHQGSPTLAIPDDLVLEVCRYGMSELHVVAAAIGGVAAQEVIKLVTSQFVPLNNTFIYNARDGTTLTAEL